MTEIEWLTSADLRPMLEFMKDKVCERKLRLFTVACCRQIRADQFRWVYLDAGGEADDGEKILTTSASFADGAATSADLLAAIALAERVENAEAWQSERASAIATAVLAAVSLRPTDAWARELGRSFSLDSIVIEAVLQAASEALFAVASAGNVSPIRVMQADLLRCIIGNPFRSTEIDPTCLTWNDGNVRKLAQTIYVERRFEDIPILTNALIDAGCHDEEILSHCRQPGEHVRGCWVVDLLLGKK